MLNTNPNPQDPNEALLEAQLLQARQIGDDTTALLETLVAQGEKNNPEPLLEAQIMQAKQNTDKIVEALAPTSQAVSQMASFLSEMKGQKGDKGDRGEKGDTFTFDDLTDEQKQTFKGDKGDPGRDGVDGNDGLPGRDGINGKDGRDGQDGKDGVAGKTPAIDYKKIVTETVKRIPPVDIEAKVAQIAEQVSQQTNDTIQSIRSTVASKTYSANEIQGLAEFVANNSTGAGVPDGGTTGQVLTKLSDTDGDADWQTSTGGGGAVDSVNGQTGVVTLDANDVGAYTEAQVDTLLAGKANTSHTHTVAQITDFPTLAPVATSGDYDDLSNKPDLSVFDEVEQHANLAAFPVTGNVAKFYLAQDTGLLYRWTGSAYAVISAELALGETSTTAYRGDRGKIAYDHSQLTTGNPHNVTKAQVGLGNADNTSDLAKPVSTATQTALDGKANTSHTHTAANITDFATAVAATAAVTANTAKVTNATHTGDVTGATALTIANDVVTNAKLANVATATIKGRITAGTGDPEDLTAAQVRTLTETETTTQLNTRDTNNRARTNHTGTQLASTISDFATAVAATASVTANTAKITNATHTGDVTGATTLTIANDVVTNAKLANVATATFKGRTTAGTGDPEDLTATQATALLNTFTSGAKGLVPPSGGGTTNFLRADGTFAAPPGGGGGATTVDVAQTGHGLSAGNLIRSNGTNGQYAQADKDVAAQADAVGYVTAVADANNFTYQPLGHYITNNVPAVAAGTALYVGDNGALTATKPETIGVIQKPVAIVVHNATAMVMFNMRGMEVTAEDAPTGGNVSIGPEGNLFLASVTAKPTAPPANTLQVYSRRRAGTDWLEFQRSNGRDIPVMPHVGVNRINTWSPSVSATVVVSGMPRAAVGTVSHPALSSTNLSTSIRRWRVQSTATANAVADERAAVTLCWRGNAAGLGGWIYTSRLSLTIVPALTRAFFGLHSGTGALATTTNPKALLNVVGIGFTQGVDTNWQVYHNDGAGVVTELDTGFPITSLTNVYTLFITASPNASSIWVRVVEEVSGTLYEAELTTNIPASTTFLTVHNYMNNGGTALACAYDCSGVYLETDY